MRNIEILLHDGFIGNKSILLALSSLTTGQLNSKIRQGVTPYKMQDILPLTHEYIVPPPTEAEKAELLQKNLLSYMALHPKK